jgi:hypothetical protein
MSEYARNNQEQEMFSLGKAFMGFLFGVGAIGGIWFLTGLLELLLKHMG